VILYSIVPHELVFQGNNYMEAEKLREAYYNGERIIVAEKPDKSYEIRRLLSTNPRIFLNPIFQPGSTVDGSLLKMIDK